MINGRLVISHAYNGFIYLPLFLAKKRDYFPFNPILIHSGGDENAIRELLLGTKKNGRSDFAICDPIAVNDLAYITGEQAFGINNDRAVVIGSLIERTPVWLYNPDLGAKSVQTLKQLIGRIRKVRCYDWPNTGYFIGRLVQEILSRGNELPVELNEVKFDWEFKDSIARDELVITSDVLRMLEERAGDQNVVYNFSSKPERDPTTAEFKQIFFTGIVTRESILRTAPFTVIGILRALRKAVVEIYSENIDSLVEGAYETLAENLTKANLITKDRDSVMLLIQEAILRIFRSESIFSTDLEPSPLEWKRSVMLRQRFPKITSEDEWEPPSFKDHACGMPAVLFNRDWVDRVTVRSKIPRAGRNLKTRKKK